MRSILNKLGLTEENPGVFADEWRGGGAIIEKISPIDGKVLARVRTASDEDYEWAVSRAHEAFLKWRTTPGPVRGQTVRRLGNALRDFKHDLGQLVTLETALSIFQLRFGRGMRRSPLSAVTLRFGRLRKKRRSPRSRW